MEESTKKAPLLDEDGLFNDLLAEEEQNASTKETDDELLDDLDFGDPKEEQEEAEEDPLDALDLSAPLPTLKEATAEKDDFDLDGFSFDIKGEIATASFEDQADELLDILDEINIANSYHPWRISLYEKLPFICEADGEEKVFLIGYGNGQTAREKETHFHQHETDPIPYVISLDPDPHFISYSFFYGFFRQTIEEMCRKNAAQDELHVAVKKKIADAFFKKYTFDFRNNPQLLRSMREYVETMIENIMDSMEKGGEDYDGCR
ncbi:MAG: hypothetical protein IJX81_04700 [Clostridia bacterium]|nr:hypothetical protein [Clostridia bacterium]